MQRLTSPPIPAPAPIPPPVDPTTLEEHLAVNEESVPILFSNEKTPKHFDLNTDVDQLTNPILGVIVVEFLGNIIVKGGIFDSIGDKVLLCVCVYVGFYGEALECGRHGFSVRDGGFRFEVQGSQGAGVPAHPQVCLLPDFSRGQYSRESVIHHSMIYFV